MTALRCTFAWKLFRIAALGLMLLLGQRLSGHSAHAQSTAQPPANSPVSEALVAKGQRIYREGVGSNGQPLLAVGSAQAVLSGSQVACAICHRRSGYGTIEGQFNIRPIVAPALFEAQSIVVRSPRIKAQLGSRQRPPYSEATLARVIRSGMDSAGELLELMMPRYQMGEEDMKAIAAYLATLSAKSSPGVDDESIHFATVIQPGVNPVQRQAMLDIMQAFFRDKGGEARSADKRRDAGTMRMNRAFRKWELQVWELTGSSDTWRAQLDAFYREQPVFALVGGLGVESWQPIHDFSEQMEIPSLFPQVNLPVVTGKNDYNLYFSRGVTLDAQVLAKFLRDRGELGKLVQVYNRDMAGSTAASAFRQALPPGAVLEDMVLDGPPDDATWRKLAAMKADARVLWMSAAALDAAPAFADGLKAPTYLSFNWLHGKLPVSASRLGTPVRMVYPTDLPPKHAARMLRTKIWLHNKGIPIVDETVQVNTQFALTVLSDGIGHIMDSFSRDYLIERVEHVVNQTPTPSVFQSMSLGPGQRFAAKGSSVVEFGEGESPTLRALSGWVIP